MYIFPFPTNHDLHCCYFYYCKCKHRDRYGEGAKPIATVVPLNRGGTDPTTENRDHTGSLTNTPSTKRSHGQLWT